MTFLFVVWALRINFFLFEGHIGDNALVCVIHGVITGTTVIGHAV